MTLPPWFDPAQVILSVDVTAMLAKGVHPLQAVRDTLDACAPGSIVELRSTFEPAPLLEVFRGLGMEVWCEGGPGAFHTCIRKSG
ncbi:sulfurtransferase TusA family protein [Mesoterricola silvestris]|uniref:DUF2249 domain-containing protein n=1 Tax=Mesoterricola silvestris TaxID=2927979 RepID=A0AA48KAP6_9BACT|nr:hypothetical protein [Mesoterricola silvestris]BDU71708.1 hypothetical protein METEAL_08820 [Mesoterricola silvestris]